MRTPIRWATRNPQAMNTIMLVVMVMGIFSFGNMRRESFPEFDLEIILVSVPYPGASPEEVEEGICQKIEVCIRSRSWKRPYTILEFSEGWIKKKHDHELPCGWSVSA